MKEAQLLSPYITETEAQCDWQGNCWRNKKSSWTVIQDYFLLKLHHLHKSLRGSSNRHTKQSLRQKTTQASMMVLSLFEVLESYTAIETSVIPSMALEKVCPLQLGQCNDLSSKAASPSHQQTEDVLLHNPCTKGSHCFSLENSCGGQLSLFVTVSPVDCNIK